MNHLEKRIIDISRAHKLSHIGSCLSALPLLWELYQHKKKDDIIILDNAHAHLAHLVVREHVEGIKGIEDILAAHGIHCDRKAGCDASGGSLGHGIGIGIGYALANRQRNVYVMVSDGSMMEGSNWEALRIRDSLGLRNLQIICNFNGYSALAPVDRGLLETRMRAFCRELDVEWTVNGEGLEGLQGHYKVL